MEDISSAVIQEIIIHALGETLARKIKVHEELLEAYNVRTRKMNAYAELLEKMMNFGWLPENEEMRYEEICQWPST